MVGDRPETMLRESARQRRLPGVPVPEVCLLDPDGDITRLLRRQGRGRAHPGWACFHTCMTEFREEGRDLGVVSCAVGAPFSVLVAEQLFASGCQLLISVSSSGKLAPWLRPRDFILIDEALRDEGTSYHYLPPADYSQAPAALLRELVGAFHGLPVRVHQGTSWTTDAPFRETPLAISAMQAREILAVEMEAAALYAFAEACSRPVLCFAQITNQMGQAQGDFEKGEANGALDALMVILQTAERLLGRRYDFASTA